MRVAIRARVEPGELAGLLRRSVAALDPALPVTRIRTLESVRSRSVARPRFLMGLFLAFSGLALALAAVGVYGVVAHAVGRRTRELGIRMALGADAFRIQARVLRESALLVLVGLGLGGLFVPLPTRPLADLLYQVDPGDPLTLAGVATILAAVALLASYVPARRAARVDPVDSLRAE